MTRGYTHEKMHDDLHVGSNGMESTRRQTLEVNSLDWKCPMFDPRKGRNRVSWSFTYCPSANFHVKGFHVHFVKAVVKS
jgi:hypothetical protein